MSCEFADTTTLLWLHGEAQAPLDDRHLHHIAACEDCLAVVALHEAVGEVLTALPSAPPFVLAAPEPTRAANQPLWGAGVLLLAIAAAVVLVLMLPGRMVPEPGLRVLVVEAGAADPLRDTALFAQVDAELEALDLELADLSYDLTSL